MLRFVNICLVLGLGALAYVIYEVKYEARGLDEDISGIGKDIDGERDSIAVLRAEWSLLNRPERIERLAIKYLKLQPAKPEQLVTLDTVSEHDFQRARVAAADQIIARRTEVAAGASSDAPATGGYQAAAVAANAAAPATLASGKSTGGDQAETATASTGSPATPMAALFNADQAQQGLGPSDATLPAKAAPVAAGRTKTGVPKAMAVKTGSARAARRASRHPSLAASE